MAGNNQIQKVTLIGASGNIGSILLTALLESKAFQVTALTRSAPSAASFPADVKVIQTAYNEAGLVEAFTGQDAVISTVGATGVQEQKAFIDAAVKAGVKRFLPSEFSVDTLSSTVRQLVPLFQAKKDVLDYLKEKEVSGLTWTGLAAGPLLDWGLRVGFLGFNLQDKKATIWDDGDTPFSATNQGDLGKALVSILKNPAGTANKYLYVATVTTSQSAILKSLEASSGKKWDVATVSTDAQLEKGRKMVSEGDFNGMLLLVQASMWGKVTGLQSYHAAAETFANDLLGLPTGVALDAAIKEVV